MVGGKSTDLAGRAIDADARAHLEGVTFDAALKLLIAVVRQPDRAAGQEERRQRDIEREGGMIASTESAAHIGKQGLDVRRLEWSPHVAQHICKRFSGVVRRLHAEHEFEVFGARIVPAETAFRLEKHRIDGLRFEFAVEHQKVWIARRKLRADLLAEGWGFGIGPPRRCGGRRPYRQLRVLKMSGTDP